MGKTSILQVHTALKINAGLECFLWLSVFLFHLCAGVYTLFLISILKYLKVNCFIYDGKIKKIKLYLC